MQPQKLCLKWHSHTANLLSVLGGFQQRDILVDVTISCEGQNIKAHKMVLSACSPYFQNIFLENPCQHPVVIINGMKYEDIAAILNFMYKGEVNISQDGLASFLQAAEALKVKGLAEKDCEKKSTNSSSQEVQQTESQNRPQRTETPPRKRHRRKRSLSDSNRSDDEGSSRKQHREPSSPEVHELSGDESFTGDTNSNGPPFNSVPRVPQNVYSRSHQSSSNLGDDDDEFEVEPSKLLEQNMTTDSVSMNNSSAEKGLRIERIMGNADLESSSLQEPESPPDIKPIIDYGDSSAGPSETGMMLYNEQSQPGPSSLQDGSLQLHDNAHTQDYMMKMLLLSARLHAESVFNRFSHDKGATFKCDRCPYVTEKLINFEKHLSIHISDKTFDCSKCGEEFHTEMDILRHLCTFSGLKIFTCDYCTKEFGFEKSLRKHLRKHTCYQSFSCNQCSQKFHEKGELLRHEKTHAAGKKADCHLCEKSFRERKDLMRHLQSHSGEKPHTCEECGKKFSRKNDLMRHSRLHTGEKHFNCEYCGKEFYRKDKLKIHVRIHTGEKPFTCEQCGRCFAAKTDMLRHVRLHSSQCEYCGQKFSLKNSVNHHVCPKQIESNDNDHVCLKESEPVKELSLPPAIQAD